MADADVQGMLIRIEATTAQLRQEIARGEAAVAQSAGKMDTSLGRIDTAFDRAGSSAQNASGLIKSALAAAIGAASIGTIIKTADSYSQMADRIGLATQSFGEYNTVQERLLATANRTYRPLEEAQELYIRTSDSLRSMGLSASQSMDVMDSFSYLLVTNSASADKASSAIDAYSKSLQTGKIDADAWQSILAAMPTVVDTIAQATGKTSEQIRSLGAQGKLSLDTLTEGLQKSAEANGRLADSMGVAVHDALVALNNAFTVYVGRLNESTDLTGVLASGISALADNFGTIAEIAGVAAVGALAAYARSLTASAAGAVLATKASIEDTLARRAQAASVLLAAQADQQKAQTAVFLAEKELAASKTRISGMAVEKQLSIQLAEARMVEARATTAVGAAQAAIVGTGRSLLGLLGGPAGIALLAVGAATAFLTLRDNTGTLEKKLGDLADPMDKLIDRFNKLNRATQSVTLRELKENIAETQDKLAQMSGAMADKFESDLRNMGAAGADGLMSGLASLPEDTQAALDLVRKASKDQASGMTVDWKAVADQLRLVPGVTEEMAQALESSQGPVTDLTALLQKQQQTLVGLTGETDEHTRAVRENAAAQAAAEAAGQKFIEQQEKKRATVEDKTAMDEANRFLKENTKLTAAQVETIKANAAAIDKQKAADKAAAKAKQDATSAATKAATETANQTKALKDLKAQADIAIASATGLAAAYLAGTDKSRDFALQQKVEEALLKTGAAARAEVTDKIKKQMAAEDQLAVSKQAYDLQKETTDLIAQAKATLLGTDALEAYNVQKAMQIVLAGKNIEVGSKEYQQLLDATKAQQDAVKVAKQAADAGSIVDRLYPASKLLRDYTEDQAALNKAIELYPEKADAYRDALQRLGVEYEQNQRSATAWGQFTEGAVDRIDEAFANMWDSVLSKSGDFMDTLKNSFRQFLAEMLHMAITKPIIVQFASALGIGGAAAQSSGLFGDLSGTGGTGIMSYLNTAKNVVSVAGSKFGEAVMSGWGSGDGLVGGIEGAFGNGADYVKSAISSAFTSGSAVAATNFSEAATNTLAASYANYGAQFGTGIASESAFNGTLNSAVTAQSAAASSLQTLSVALSYIQGVYTIFTSFQDYGLKGAAVTGGAAAAGAMIGSYIMPGIGTAIGFAVGAVAGAFGANAWFGSGEKYPDLSTSAQGTYSNGQYQSGGIVQGWQTKAPKYGAAADAQMDSTVNQFTRTLGMLYDVLGNGADVYAYDMMQVRKTSGRYSTTFGATLDDGTGVGLDIHQQFDAADAAEALQHNYDDIMGTFLAKAIVSSKSLPDYFKAQFTDFANSWDTTADEVIKAIEGVFTRFNGVNDALSLINVNNLKLDETGMIASDSILNMVGAMADLDTTTATAKEKVDALNTAVGTYYQAFFSADEQFADLTKSLQGAFAGFGLELPDERSAYRAMVEDIDVTTAAGQAMFATLVGLAQNADSYYGHLEDTAKAAADAAAQAASDAQQAAATAAQALMDSLMKGASDAFSALQRSITAQQKATTDAYNARTASLNDMLSTASTNVSDLTGVSNDLSSALKALRGDSDDAVKMLRAQAQATLQNALAMAKAGGSLTGFAGLNDALDTVSSNNTNLYSSLEDFNRDQGRTANVVSQLEALNGKQLTNAEQSVKALQDQLEQAKQAYDTQMAEYDAQLAIGQAQLDALNGVDTRVLSVTDAVNRMNAAVVAALSGLPATGTGSAMANTWENNASLVHSAYQTAFGRDADEGGLRFWTDALQNGTLTYDQLMAELVKIGKQNGESINIPGYATGGLISGPGTGTSDSILARLSAGEYIVNADAVRTYGTGLLDQLNGLRLPAFASGGPVLDVVGPSQIYGADQASSMLNKGESNASLAAEIRALGGRLDMIQAETKAGALNTGKVAKLLDRVTDGGNAMLTKELA